MMRDALSGEGAYAAGAGKKDKKGDRAKDQDGMD